MIITKKRILNIANYIAPFKNHEAVYVACKIIPEDEMALRTAGFPEPNMSGIKILPSGVGPISKFNLDGSDIPLMNLPKEIYYRDAITRDWHGGYHYVTIPGTRYRRKHIDAPMEEISLVEIDQSIYVVSNLIPLVNSTDEKIKHVINLFLELFGRCELIDENKHSLIESTPLKRANWKILPEGDLVWERVADSAGGIKDHNELTGKLQKFRFITVINYHPDAIYYGTGGFHGYLVFTFKNKGLVVMENMMYGNATFVFRDDWEELSKKSKAEIIQNKLHVARITHNGHWCSELSKYL